VLPRRIRSIDVGDRGDGGGVEQQLGAVGQSQRTLFAAGGVVIGAPVLVIDDAPSQPDRR
jgi:hypothetical protein